MRRNKFKMKKQYLFFDTETTGKAYFDAPCDADHQPRLVQLGCILTDASGNEFGAVNLIIKPQGWTIPAEAAAIHGITTEHALAVGVPLYHALMVFGSLMRVATDRVAHNVDFDDFIMAGECSRLMVELKPTTKHCTMKSMTQACALAKRSGHSGYKWPNLQEAYRHCFAREFAGAHDAMADVRACRDVFFWKEKNLTP